MGGIMARAADRAAIHRRMLNASKGSAVRGPRVQADRRLYREAVAELVAEAGVTVIEGEAVGLRSARAARCAASSWPTARRSKRAAVVLATGTFLGATMFRGEERWIGGRLGGQAASALACQVRELGLAQGRLKTGTPPRLDGRTIDWARTAAAAERPLTRGPWRWRPTRGRSRSSACAITRTNARSHDVIRAGLGRSPLFAGAIEGRGPRYCPSIEDKVHRFGDRDGHQIFLEPEGLDDASCLSQRHFDLAANRCAGQTWCAASRGWSGAEIVQPGYAVEYEYADPRRLEPTLAASGGVRAVLRRPAQRHDRL